VIKLEVQEEEEVTTVIIVEMIIVEMITEEMIVEEETIETTVEAKIIAEMTEMIIIIVEEGTIEGLGVMDLKKEVQVFLIVKGVEIIIRMVISMIEMEAVEEIDKVTTTTIIITIIEMDVLLIMDHEGEVTQRLVGEINHNSNKNNLKQRLMDSKLEEERRKLLIQDQLAIFQEMIMTNHRILINNLLLSLPNQLRNLGIKRQNLSKAQLPIFLPI